MWEMLRKIGEENFIFNVVKQVTSSNLASYAAQTEEIRNTAYKILVKRHY
jgi:hypothetical protein